MRTTEVVITDNQSVRTYLRSLCGQQLSAPPDGQWQQVQLILIKRWASKVRCQEPNSSWYAYVNFMLSIKYTINFGDSTEWWFQLNSEFLNLTNFYAIFLYQPYNFLIFYSQSFKLNMSGQTTVLTRSDDLEYQTSYLYRRIFFHVTVVQSGASRTTEHSWDNNFEIL